MRYQLIEISEAQHSRSKRGEKRAHTPGEAILGEARSQGRKNIYHLRCAKSRNVKNLPPETLFSYGFQEMCLNVSR